MQIIVDENFLQFDYGNIAFYCKKIILRPFILGAKLLESGMCQQKNSGECERECGDNDDDELSHHIDGSDMQAVVATLINVVMS